MSTPVKLYVYDLSNGMAKQLSLSLTGRQIDGIWHTSVVVFDKEVFYGQGIDITAPGKSHHGAPSQIIDLGTTSIDQDTFEEYLEEMREQYTADKYHLLDFNCNSFTNDCAGFLTGGSIPDFIKDLPTDFLSTPFGSALRPTIDAMYRRPSPNATPAQSAPPDASLAASLLQAVASQAGPSNAPPSGLPDTQSLAGALHLCTNSATLRNILSTHRAVIVNFSDVTTCMPCRIIAPVYEQMANEKGIRLHSEGGRTGAVFVKVDMSTGHGQSVASEWGVRVMPTFIFFLDGKKIDELKGADANELRSQVDLLLFQAYPPHPHISLSLPAVQAVSTDPILFTQVPPLDTVMHKLVSFIDGATWSAQSPKSQVQVKQILTQTVIPFLKARFTPGTGQSLPSADPTMLTSWGHCTDVLSSTLPIPSLFPVVDIWRLILLDPSAGVWLAANPSNPANPIRICMTKSATNIQSAPRNYVLTLLRMLSNAFGSAVLGQRMVTAKGKVDLVAIMIPALLHEDAAVRTAGASLAFNAAAVLQKARVGKAKSGGQAGGLVEDEDWEVEMVSAIIEALDREKENEEVVHRLTAALAFLLRLSPFYESQLSPLLEVLQAKDVLKSKLTKGGCSAEGVSKKEIKLLVEEVANQLCP